MKKLFFLLIICLVALSLTFCGQQKPAEEPAVETETMEAAAADTGVVADSVEAEAPGVEETE
ncbi:MAG: hypothetical protein JW956_03030 [Calditrichaceae bacterium]|nr:hypothetical protein [Calditrichaceae bacterium]